MRVRYNSRAWADLTAVNTYIIERNPAGARKVMAAIRRAGLLLSDHPRSGQATDIPKVRVKLVAKYPYKIFYRVDSGSVEILHIRHTARKPWDGNREEL